MIPVALPSVEFLLTAIGLLMLTLLWAAWSLWLVLDRRSWRRLRRWRLALYLLLSLGAAGTLWTLYDIRRHYLAFAAAQARDYHPVLGADARLGGLDMLAGTALDLALPGDLASFRRARFPRPVPILGIAALEVERYLAMQVDADHRTSGFIPTTLYLRGQGQARQAGWLCDAALTIGFETGPEGQPQDFLSCTLAEGNRVAGAPLPAGTEVVATEGRLFLDGRRGEDRWILHLPATAAFAAEGRHQQGGALLLDAARALHLWVPR